MSDSNEPAVSSVRRFVGTGLMAVGWLIVVLAGLCTSGVVIMYIGTIVTAGRAGFGQAIAAIVAAAPYPLFIGGIPIGIGVALIFAGRSITRPGGPTP